MPKVEHITAPTQYATSADFRQIFHDEMEGLYLLSFLLTADREKAEQCFVSGIEDSIKGNQFSRNGRARGLGGSSLRTPYESSSRGQWRKLGLRSPTAVAKRWQRSRQRLPWFLRSNRSSALSMSCRFLNATPITIVRFSWGARAGK